MSVLSVSKVIVKLYSYSLEKRKTFDVDAFEFLLKLAIGACRRYKPKMHECNFRLTYGNLNNASTYWYRLMIYFQFQL